MCNIRRVECRKDMAAYWGNLQWEIRRQKRRAVYYQEEAEDYRVRAITRGCSAGHHLARDLRRMATEQSALAQIHAARVLRLQGDRRSHVS